MIMFCIAPKNIMDVFIYYYLIEVYLKSWDVLFLFCDLYDIENGIHLINYQSKEKSMITTFKK